MLVGYCRASNAARQSDRYSEVCCPGIATGGVGIGPHSSFDGTIVGSVELRISSQVTALPV